MEISVNNGTSIVASLKEQLEPKDNISSVCTDQPAYDNDVSVSEEEFYETNSAWSLQGNGYEA